MRLIAVKARRCFDEMYVRLKTILTMFRRLLLSVAAAMATLFADGAEPVWQDPAVNQQNREPRRADFFAYESLPLTLQGQKGQSARYLSMEGK